MRAHFLTPYAALLEAAGEDLAVVNLLATEDSVRAVVRSEDGRIYPVVSNILAFSGQQPALERPGHLVVVNSYNQHALLGELALLNCHRVVYPLSVGVAGPVGHWLLADWCDQCHRKGGLVVWTDVLGANLDLGSPYGEGLADLLLQKIDAIEFSLVERSTAQLEEEWYAFLGAGCRVPLLGASAKTSNEEPLGEYRTYARLPPGEPLSYRNWIEAVRAGRTFLTSGPLLSFTVNGRGPGEVLTLPSLDEPVHIVAEARSLSRFDRLELLLNGGIYRCADAAGSPPSASLDFEAKPPAPGWLAARCSTQARFLDAHTSPVYVQVGGRPPPVDATKVAQLTSALDSLLQWAAMTEDGDDEARRSHQRLLDVLQSARKVLIERART
jgi:hypothetical protein